MSPSLNTSAPRKINPTLTPNLNDGSTPNRIGEPPSATSLQPHLDVGEPLEEPLEEPPSSPSLQSHLLIAALYTITVFLASIYPALITPEQNYFSLKRNKFNTIFAKYGWFWTTMVFAYHTSRLRATQPLQAVLRWALATAWWVLVTQWCFGPPIMDRTFLYTGGLCELATNPDVDHGQLTAGELLVSSAACKLAKGAWKGGHDLSGHVFMLTHASLFLLSESIPVLLSKNIPVGWNRANWAVLILLALWWWMLVMTGVHFHTWWEKVTGLLVGLAEWGFVYVYLLREVRVTRNVLGLPDL